MQDDSWLSAREIANKLKINNATVSDLVVKYKLSILKRNKKSWFYKLDEIQNVLLRGHPNQFNKRFLTPPNTKLYDDFWQLNWDEFIVGADMHVPLVEEKIFNRMLEFASKSKINKFVHAGDFFDQIQFSFFDVDKEDIVDWSDEIKCAKKIYGALSEVFTEIKFFMGSHDLRFWRMLSSAGKASNYNSAFIQADIPEEDTSRYRYCQVGTEWHITHPKNVVKINSAPALRLGAKYQRSIVIGHGHWWGVYRDPSGTHYQIAPGCLTDTRKHSYASLWDTSHDRWTPGFLAVVDKNKPILFSNDSPWEIYLNGKTKTT